MWQQLQEALAHADAQRQEAEGRPFIRSLLLNQKPPPRLVYNLPERLTELTVPEVVDIRAVTMMMHWSIE